MKNDITSFNIRSKLVFVKLLTSVCTKEVLRHTSTAKPK